MSIKEEFLKFLSDNGLDLSPCVLNDENLIPPKAEWQSFVDNFNKLFEATEITDDDFDEF